MWQCFMSQEKTKVAQIKYSMYGLIYTLISTSTCLHTCPLFAGSYII